MNTASLDVENQKHVQLLQKGNHYDPHAFLGLHPKKKQHVIRLWRPEARSVHLYYRGTLVEANQIDPAGLFEYSVSSNTTLQDYKVYHANGLLAEDGYSFWPTVGEVDQYLFGKGVHYNIYNLLGAHLMTYQGVKGVRFAVWAPGVKRVSLVGDFNFWDGRSNPMRSLGASGIWEIFIPGLDEGEKYKFEIKTRDDSILLKADPYGYSSEMRPYTASIVADVNSFEWDDEEWMDRRKKKKDEPSPVNIYEVHLGSWKRHHDLFLNYRDLAVSLVDYCKEMGFTHVELMPVQEHPLDESWGYQVTGYYAVTSRYGTPEDFQWFVNHFHKNNIGVILDWVPGHFPIDDHGLARFDGTALYEHEDPRQGFHPHWQTYIFNYGRHEVVNFLIGNALYWFDRMHIDGLRVDAVASMLYLDYGRESGEWVPNVYGDKENLEAIEFLKHLNSIVHQHHPGVMMIAEESTSFTGVTKSSQQGGLGFDLKWNMGWMNDTLRYFSKDMLFRHYHHNDLTFGLLYAFSERFALVLSHDEVVHGKNSLLGRMPGDLWQRFANLRLLYSYMICQPGKKLLFMGGEIGQWNEWSCKREIEWFLLDYPTHKGIQNLVKDLNHLYLQNPILWEKDFDYTGFEWVDFSDQKNSVISYLRKSSHGTLLCIHNFTPEFHSNYQLPLSNVASIEEIFNSDDATYGGSGKLNKAPYVDFDKNHHASSIHVQIAPLATMIFRVAFWN